jgi:predicted DNA-binding helix-hairpin-helix protein
LPAAVSEAAEPRPLYDASPQGTPRAGTIAETSASARALPGAGIGVQEARRNRSRNPESSILPAGQTTQLVVGASPESDATILTLSENLYLAYDVRRVYYSAFIPIGADPRLPAPIGPPLLREHRLYQADWLFRFYGFRADEILGPDAPNLDPDIDPKCAWALRHPESFPIEVNTAEYLELLRVPGIGPRSAARIVRARSNSRLKPESLKALGVVMKRAAYFVTCSGVAPKTPGSPREIRLDGSGARAGFFDNARIRLTTIQPELEWQQDTRIGES